MIDPLILDYVVDHPQWLIVTDLDGTLLDHHDYNHHAVDDLLVKLESINIPVIINSSKTANEIVELRKEINNHHPFIVENGSAIFIPHNYFDSNTIQRYSASTKNIENESFIVIELGANLETIHDFLDESKNTYQGTFSAFSQTDDQSILNATGLALDQVKKSKQRLFSEPLIWSGDEQQKSEFRQSASDAGLNTLQGGRFLHVLGQCDKGLATKELVSIYEMNSENIKAGWRTIALGDSGNDIDMLKSASIAIVIRSPTQRPPIIENHTRTLTSTETGPEGWNEAISELFLEKIKSKKLNKLTNLN